MRRFSLRFGVALLSFVFGLGAATAWHSIHPRFSRSIEEENIMEAVFRHQVSEEHGSESSRLFFVSPGVDVDPSDEFMYRFRDLPRVRSLSQGNKKGDGVTDKLTGVRGEILFIHRIEWVNNAEVTVAVGTYSWGWGQSASHCNVEHKDGKWIVKGCELTLIT